MRSVIRLITILSIVLISMPTMAQNYFKWTDESGVTHYSARKPIGHEAEVVRISAGGRSEQQQEQQESAQSTVAQTGGAEQTAAAANTAALKDAERCDWAKTTLSVLRNNNRVRTQDESGDLRYLNEEEKADQRRQAEQAQEEAC